MNYTFLLRMNAICYGVIRWDMYGEEEISVLKFRYLMKETGRLITEQLIYIIKFFFSGVMIKETAEILFCL